MDINKILNTVFFPGIVFHETAHAIACLLLGVSIKKIKFIGKDGGYVIHDDSRSYKIIIISLFPFFFNIFISLICARAVLLENNFYIIVFATWIALSVIYFSLPSAPDAKNVFSVIKRTYFKKQSFLLILIKIIFIPITLAVIFLVFLFRLIDRSVIIRFLMLVIWIYLFLL